MSPGTTTKTTERAVQTIGSAREIVFGSNKVISGVKKRPGILDRISLPKTEKKP